MSHTEWGDPERQCKGSIVKGVLQVDVTQYPDEAGMVKCVKQLISQAGVAGRPYAHPEPAGCHSEIGWELSLCCGAASMQLEPLLKLIFCVVGELDVDCSFWLLRQKQLLQHWSYLGSFEGSWHISCSEWVVDDGGDCRQKLIQVLLQEPGWHGVQMTVLGWWEHDDLLYLFLWHVFPCRERAGWWCTCRRCTQG